jgi:hypothetical protein
MVTEPGRVFPQLPHHALVWEAGISTPHFGQDLARAELSVVMLASGSRFLSARLLDSTAA